jgi:hypothetical protein
MSVLWCCVGVSLCGFNIILFFNSPDSLHSYIIFPLETGNRNGFISLDRQLLSKTNQQLLLRNNSLDKQLSLLIPQVKGLVMSSLFDTLLILVTFGDWRWLSPENWLHSAFLTPELMKKWWEREKKKPHHLILEDHWQGMLSFDFFAYSSVEFLHKSYFSVCIYLVGILVY